MDVATLAELLLETAGRILGRKKPPEAAATVAQGLGDRVPAIEHDLVPALAPRPAGGRLARGLAPLETVFRHRPSLQGECRAAYIPPGVPRGGRRALPAVDTAGPAHHKSALAAGGPAYPAPVAIGGMSRAAKGADCKSAG